MMRKGYFIWSAMIAALLGAGMLVSCNNGGSSRSSAPTGSPYDYIGDEDEAFLMREGLATDSSGIAGSTAKYQERSRRVRLSDSPASARVGPPASDNRDWNQSTKLHAAVRDALPSRQEELWIITPFHGDDDARDRPVGDDDYGSGVLLTRFPGDDREVPVPLESTNVDADIAGYIASVNVKQRYHNPFDVKIEAVYAFPLPQNAAVNGFIMTVGDRRIRGVIREREEATKIYNQAKAQGKVASLMSQERPNIFTQKVANIEPGRVIDIDITYHHTVAYDDGWHEWAFPMTIGPRYNPTGSRGGIGAVPRGAKYASGQSVEVQYLSSNESSVHRVGLNVKINAGVPIEEIECETHDVDVRWNSDADATVILSQYDDLPNRDFVLRYRVAGDVVKTALLTHRSGARGNDDYFSLVLYPPLVLDHLERGPMEMIFVLDCSGSMNGEPIEQAKAAVAQGLEMLRPEDTFQIIRFSNNASQLGDQPLRATRSNINIARKYLRGLHGSGGTQMVEGIRSALRFSHDRHRQRFVVFLTDGFIGNEAEILKATHKHLGDARVFSFGVGSSPNRYLMDRMAKIGRGAVAYLGAGDSGDEVMERFFERASRAAMTDIKVHADGVRLFDVYPKNLPDLFVGRPVVIAGKFEGTGDGLLRIEGKVAGRRVVIESRLDVNNADTEHPAIATIWARHRIADLMDQSTWKGIGGVTRAIRNTALDYGLISAFTSFVAVDSLSQTSGAHGVSVDVPVRVPQGVRYQTTVGK